LDLGEITDKGSINQRAVLRHRAECVAALYAPEPLSNVMEIAGLGSDHARPKKKQEP
jgi:feruloyl-CoA synthase